MRVFLFTLFSILGIIVNMIKFIRKKHIKSDLEKGKIVIYYSIPDIFLGIILFGLVVFFINNYLSNTLGKYDSGDFNNSSSALNTVKSVDKK